MSLKKKTKWLIVGNWKMNPIYIKDAKKIFSGIKKVASRMKNVDTVICPPFIYLSELKSSGHRCVLGSQDIFYEPEGSHTGNISYLQVKNLGIKYSIVGHSERRVQGESDEIINKKIKASLRAMVTPILCIGEEDRVLNGDHFHFLKNQLETNLTGLPKNSIKDIVIAYEPIWAIGKDAKREPTPEEIFAVVIFIKKVLSDIYGTKSVPPTKILYGGSVDQKNIEEILKDGGVDGVLVGRASLVSEKFGNLLKIADNLKR